MRRDLRIFVLGLLVAGLAFAGLQLVPESNAGDGGWTCYVTDRFPDMDDAASWKGSLKAAEGLNKVAGHAASGEMLVITLPVQTGPQWGGSNREGAPSVLCVKK
jgi:hypothetical protein